MGLELAPDAKQLLAERGYDPVHGRPAAAPYDPARDRGHAVGEDPLRRAPRRRRSSRSTIEGEGDDAEVHLRRRGRPTPGARLGGRDRRPIQNWYGPRPTRPPCERHVLARGLPHLIARSSWPRHDEVVLHCVELRQVLSKRAARALPCGRTTAPWGVVLKINSGLTRTAHAGSSRPGRSRRGGSRASRGMRAREQPVQVAWRHRCVCVTRRNARSPRLQRRRSPRRGPGEPHRPPHPLRRAGAQAARRGADGRRPLAVPDAWPTTSSPTASSWCGCAAPWRSAAWRSSASTAPAAATRRRPAPTGPSPSATATRWRWPRSWRSCCRTTSGSAASPPSRSAGAATGPPTCTPSPPAGWSGSPASCAASTASPARPSGSASSRGPAACWRPPSRRWSASCGIDSEHLGVCLDACHLACGAEEPGAALRGLARPAPRWSSSATCTTTASGGSSPAPARSSRTPSPRCSPAR